MTRQGLNLFELPPGQTAYPYHWHLGEEELIVVLEGRPSSRTPDGWRGLEQEEAVAFLVGDQGAHQVANETESPVRFLAFSKSAAATSWSFPSRARPRARQRDDQNWLLPQGRGGGLATTAVSLISDWAFTELEIGRLAAFTVSYSMTVH